MLSPTGLFPTPTTSDPNHLCFWPTSYNSEAPTTLSLGSNNLFEWLTELTETFYLLDYQFIIKGYNSRIARWKRHVGQGVGKDCGASVPSPGAPHLHVFTNTKILLILSFQVFTETSLHRHDWLSHGHWQSIQLSVTLPCWKSGDGTENSNLLANVSSPGKQPPSLGAVWKSPY